MQCGTHAIAVDAERLLLSGPYDVEVRSVRLYEEAGTVFYSGVKLSRWQ